MAELARLTSVLTHRFRCEDAGQKADSGALEKDLRSDHAVVKPTLAERFLAGAAVLVIGFYPVRSFLLLADLPLALRLTWPVAFGASLIWPFPAILAFVAGAPLVASLPPIFGWPRVSLAEVWFFAVLCGAFLRLVAAKGRLRSGLPVAQPILLALVTASLAVGVYPFVIPEGGLVPLLARLHDYGWTEFTTSVSQRSRYAPVVAWAVIAEGMLLLWLVVSEVQGNRARAYHLIQAAAAGAVVVAVVGIDQWAFRRNLLPYWIGADPHIIRINATLSDPNSLGAYLAMMLWIVVALRSSSSGKWTRRLWWVGAFLVAAAVVFTGSRSAWVAATGAGVLYGAARARFSRRTISAQPRSILRPALVLSLASIVALGALSAYATARNIQHRDQRSYVDTMLYSLNLNLSMADRLKGRLVLWQAAVNMVEEAPVFGIGVGRFYKEVWRYAPWPDKLWMVSVQDNAHNYFLQIVAETGLAGLACLLSLLLVAMASAARASPADGPDYMVLVAAGTGVTAFAATCMTGHSLLLREGQFALWTVAGALMAVRRRRSRPVTGFGLTHVRLVGKRVLTAILITAVFASVPFRMAHAVGRIDQAQVTSGLGPEETGPQGEPFQWMEGPRALFYIPAEARVLTLPLRSLAPFPQQVSVRFDGKLGDRLLIDDHAWRRLRYVLPRTEPSRRYRRVEIVVDPIWQPEGDGRHLGVAVGAYSFSP